MPPVSLTETQHLVYALFRFKTQLLIDRHALAARTVQRGCNAVESNFFHIGAHELFGTEINILVSAPLLVREKAVRNASFGADYDRLFGRFCKSFVRREKIR